MRAIVAAMLILVGVLGSGIPSAWNQVASADDGCGRPGTMMRHERIPGPGSYGRGRHEGPRIRGMLRWKEELGLTPEQVRALWELRTNSAIEAIRRTADIRVAELQLHGLLEQDKVDLDKVEAQTRKTAFLHANRRLARIKTIEAGKALLTPDQQEKFKQLAHAARMGHSGRGMRKPGMRPGPPTQ
jgi:Spy/CpxP family protein refolding chaperone